MLKKNYRHTKSINLTLSDHKKLAFSFFSLRSKQKNANCFCPSAAADYKLVLLGGKEAGSLVEKVIKNIGYQLDYLFS